MLRLKHWRGKISLNIFFGCHIFFIHSSVDEHLTCFHVLAKLNKCCSKHWASVVTQLVRNLPTIQETWVGQEYLLEKEMATHCMFFRMIFHFRYSGSHYHWFAAAAKSLQSCPILCNPMDSSPPGSSFQGIL